MRWRNWCSSTGTSLRRCPARENYRAGATAGTIAQALASDNPVLERNLGRVADISANPFVALNTGSMRDGAVVHLGKGVAVEGPIHLLFVSTSGLEPTKSFPRILVVAEENSHLTLVESFVGGGGVHFTAAVTEIAAADDCRIDHNRVQLGGDGAYAVSALSARLGRGSQLSVKRPRSVEN